MDTNTEYTHKLGTGIEAFQQSGMLWALNSDVLHSRGYEIRVDGEDVFLVGYGATARQWPADAGEAIEERRTAFRQALLDAQKFNKPSYHDGLSPGFGMGNKLK